MPVVTSAVDFGLTANDEPSSIRAQINITSAGNPTASPTIRIAVQAIPPNCQPRNTITATITTNVATFVLIGLFLKLNSYGCPRFVSQGPPLTRVARPPASPT